MDKDILYLREILEKLEKLNYERKKIIKELKYLTK